MAVLASLLVALTAAPALCALFLKARDRHADFDWIRRIKQWQDRGVALVSGRLRIVIAVLAVLAVVAAAALPFLAAASCRTSAKAIS